MQDLYYLKDSKDDFVVGMTRNDITTSWEFVEGRNAFPTAHDAATVACEIGWGYECHVVVFRGEHALTPFRKLGGCRELLG